jgi:hypothetical protein
MKKIIAILGAVILIASASHAGMRVGVECLPLTGIAGAPGGLPYIGFQLNDSQTVDVGLTYASMNNGNQTGLGLVGRFESVIMKIKNLKLNWSGILGIISVNNAGASSTTLQLQGGVGAEYMITDAFSVYGNIDILTLQNTSAGGTSTSNFMILTGNGNAYSGLRIYI